jgi:hypothetical protein
LKFLTILSAFFLSIMLFLTCKKEAPKLSGQKSILPDTLWYPPATSLKVTDKDTIGFKAALDKRFLDKEFWFRCNLSQFNYNDSLSKVQNQSVFYSGSYSMWDCLHYATWINIMLKGIKEHIKHVKGGIILDAANIPFSFSPKKEGVEFGGLYDVDSEDGYGSSVIFDSKNSEDTASGNNTVIINQMLPFTKGNKRYLKFSGTFTCNINIQYPTLTSNAKGIIVATIEEP